MVQVLAVEFIQNRVKKNSLLVNSDDRVGGDRNPVICK